MNKFLIFGIIFLIIIIVYFIRPNNSPDLTNSTNDILQKQSDIIQTIDDDNIFIDETNISETNDMAISETTNQLINNSYKNILDQVYKKIILILHFYYLNKDYEFKIELSIYKNEIMTNIFTELLRSYNGCLIYDYNKKYNILYTGDYLNNTGVTNLNINRTITLIDSYIPSFIPAKSICMIGIKKNNKIFIGSNFALNFEDINDNLYINEKVLIPFGRFEIDDEVGKIISTYYLNTTNEIRKPKIKVIYEINEQSLLS